VWKYVASILKSNRVVVHWRPRTDLVNILLSNGSLLQLSAAEDGRLLAAAELQDLTDARTFELVNRYRGLTDASCQALPHSTSMQLSGLPCSLAVLAGGPQYDTGTHFMWLRSRDYVSRWEHPLVTAAHISAIKKTREAAVQDTAGTVRMLQPLGWTEQDRLQQERFKPLGAHGKYSCMHHMQLPAAVQRVQLSALGQLVLFRGSNDGLHGAAVFAADIPRQHQQHNAVDLSLGATREAPPVSLWQRLRGKEDGVRDPGNQLLPSDALAGLSAEPLMVLPGDGTMVLQGSCTLAGPRVPPAPAVLQAAAQRGSAASQSGVGSRATEAHKPTSLQGRLQAAEKALSTAAAPQLSALQALAAAAASAGGPPHISPQPALPRVDTIDQTGPSGTVINFTVRYQVHVRGFRAPEHPPPGGDDPSPMGGAAAWNALASENLLSSTASARIKQLHAASSEEWALFRHCRIEFLEGEATASRSLHSRATSTWAIPLREAVHAAGLPVALVTPHAWLQSSEHWVAASAFDAVNPAASAASACRLQQLRIGVPHDLGNAGMPSEPARALRLRVLSCEGTSVFGRTAVEGHATMVPSLSLYRLPAGAPAVHPLPSGGDTRAPAVSDKPARWVQHAAQRVMACEASVLGMGPSGPREALVTLLRQFGPVSTGTLDAQEVSHAVELRWLDAAEGGHLNSSGSNPAARDKRDIQAVDVPVPTSTQVGRVTFDVTVRLVGAAAAVHGALSDQQALRLRFSNDRAATAFVNAANVKIVPQVPAVAFGIGGGTSASVGVGQGEGGEQGHVQPAEEPLSADGDKAITGQLPEAKRVWSELQPPPGGVACASAGFAAVREGEMEGGEFYAPRALHPERQAVFRGALGGTTGSTVKASNPAAASTKLAVRNSWLVR